MTRTILIVNGSAVRRRASRELFERAGYDVREIQSIETAIGFARRTRPLAVVFESPGDAQVAARFARRLRRNPANRNVPVLCLTPDGDLPGEFDDDEWLSWLSEPCPPRTLLEEVAYLARRQLQLGGSQGTVSGPRRQ